MKKTFLLLMSIVLISGFLLKKTVRADYVLPYPSYMPGHKLYTISKILDKLEAYWNFGNIASAKYHLKLADKYLVEAKTLFEYNQYLLAVDALKLSDQQFKLVPVFINKAGAEHKDVTVLKKLFMEAENKHINVLTKLKSEIPDSFKWMPEKTSPTEFKLSQILIDSLVIRQISF